NLGALYAEGKYLAFLDSDDLWFPWTLEVYFEVTQRQRDPPFIVGKPYLFSEQHQLQEAVLDLTRTEGFVDYLASGDEWRWWGASSFVMRRGAFEAVGGFTEEWVNGENTDLTLGMGVAPGFVQFVASAPVGDREHLGSVQKDSPTPVTPA